MRNLDDDELFDIQALMSKVGLTTKNIEQVFENRSYDEIDGILKQQSKDVNSHLNCNDLKRVLSK